jgi:hypothetical protein
MQPAPHFFILIRFRFSTPCFSLAAFALLQIATMLASPAAYRIEYQNYAAAHSVDGPGDPTAVKGFRYKLESLPFFYKASITVCLAVGKYLEKK